MFNKYCLLAANSMSFQCGIGVFYGQTPFDLLIHVHQVCSHQQNIYNLLLLCVVIVVKALYNNSHSQFTSKLPVMHADVLFL